MAKKTSGKQKPMTYAPVEVTPLPAAAEEQESHLRGFIQRFIAPHARGRWTHCLLQSPEKAATHLHRFDRDHEPRSCVELHGADAFPQSLAALFGAAIGLYFDGTAPACKMTAAEAATMAAGFRDALLSFVPGEKALFFHHEGGVWRCE